MTVSELEGEYKRARELLLRGEIDEGAFKAIVEGLRFDDGQGRQWKLGWYTGRWYRFERGEWVLGEPEVRRAWLANAAPASPGDEHGGPSRRFLARWLVAFLTALLLLTSVVLVTSLQADWWDGSQASTPAAAATETPTPAGLATATPAVQEDTSPLVPASPATGSGLITAVKPTPAQAAGPRPQQTLPAPLPRLQGRIYYPVYDGDPERQTFDIYAVRLDTGERALVVNQASQPALSPDGRRLAYRSWKTGEQGLAVLDLEANQATTWVDKPAAARPSWSPDGLRLAFSILQETGQLWRIMQATGTSLEPVPGQAEGLVGHMPVWLGETTIAYHACLPGYCGLFQLKAGGSSPERLTTGSRDTGPAAAPGGDALAFMSDRGGNWDIYVANVRTPGEEPVRLTHHSTREGLPTWSPDGRWLAFVSDCDGTWAVWIMQPDGSQQHRLFSIGGPLEGTVASLSPHLQPGWTWETMAWGP